MDTSLVTKPHKEMDTLKEPTTLDAALESKLNPVIGAIIEHVKQIYEGFNMPIFKQMNHTDKVEKDISQMVQVLWGIVNESNVRMAALETVLIKNGMNQDELVQEIQTVKEQMKAAGMEEIPLPGLNKDVSPPAPLSNQTIVETHPLG